LQAIATARRLGALVSGYDVRPAVKEQVQSLGAKFVELPLETTSAQDAGGYARELSPEQQQKQRELMARVVIESDVTIIGLTNVAGTAPFHASQMYSNNLVNLMKLILTTDGGLNIDPADEIIAG